MSSGDDWEDPYREDYRNESTDDRDEWGDESAFQDRERPASTGMSTGMKVLIVVLCILGGSALLCCGGCAYMIFRIQKGISQDPEVVKQTTREILEIDIPQEFQPVESVSFELLPMKMASYERADDKGTLLVMEMGNQFQPDGAALEIQMREMLRQHNQNIPELDIDEENVEVREFTIRGEKVDVQFGKAGDPETGVGIRQISAVFDGERGTVMLLLMLHEDVYDEAEVEAMLESIR